MKIKQVGIIALDEAREILLSHHLKELSNQTRLTEYIRNTGLNYSAIDHMEEGEIIQAFRQLDLKELAEKNNLDSIAIESPGSRDFTSVYSREANPTEKNFQDQVVCHPDDYNAVVAILNKYYVKIEREVNKLNKRTIYLVEQTLPKSLDFRVALQQELNAARATWIVFSTPSDETSPQDDSIVDLVNQLLENDKFKLYMNRAKEAVARSLNDKVIDRQINKFVDTSKSIIKNFVEKKLK